jgi:flavin reductase (DIM6/NTAB) family NADH-FMN oxidoreductase RutF
MGAEMGIAPESVGGLIQAARLYGDSAAGRDGEVLAGTVVGKTRREAVWGYLQRVFGLNDGSNGGPNDRDGEMERAGGLRMTRAFSAKGLVKRLVLGEALVQESAVAIREPQDEIAVWLYGAGPARDITHLHSIACASPFTVCIPFSSMEVIHRECGGSNVSIELRERAGTERLLGKISLKFSSAVQSGGACLALFHARSCESYCLPKVRFWAHYLQQAYWRWRDKKVPTVRMSLTDGHAMMIMFICPRPVVLVTTLEGRGGNMFPMRLMGDLGEGYFSFSLNNERQASHCVMRAGRVAVSSIPFEEAGTVRKLEEHPMKASVEWSELPLRVKGCRCFGGPVPGFALKVRLVKVETVKELGSHTFFVGKITHEETYGEGAHFYVVHGMYQRLRGATGAAVATGG